MPTHVANKLKIKTKLVSLTNAVNVENPKHETLLG